MEDLEFSPRGKVKEDIEAGFFELTGGLPVQPDGGLNLLDIRLAHRVCGWCMRCISSFKGRLKRGS